MKSDFLWGLPAGGTERDRKPPKNRPPDVTQSSEKSDFTEKNHSGEANLQNLELNSYFKTLCLIVENN